MERVPPRRPNPGTILFSLLLCGLLVACGNATTPVAPGPAPPTPTPGPTPSPTSAGYLHVLQRPFVMTYEIDPTGRLHPPVTQHMGRGVHMLAGEPRGRFVFAAEGGVKEGDYDWDASDGDGTIVTYAPDPRDGTLTPVSGAVVWPRPTEECHPLYCHRGEWVRLWGGPNRVHGLWVDLWWRWWQYTYVSVAVASDGQLGPVSRHQFERQDPGHLIVDVRSDVLYKTSDLWYKPNQGEPGALLAYVIEPDGRLKQMGRSNLCFVHTMNSSDPPVPLAAARGFLFASVRTSRGEDWRNDVLSVCSYQGLRLKPLADVDFDASHADAFVPADETEPVLLAMRVKVLPTDEAKEHAELRVFAMNAEGDLQLLDSEKLSDDWVWGDRQLLFHPSRRLLYVVDEARRSGQGWLGGYTVGANGQLELVESIDSAGGSMAITLENAQTAER
jgi:6-phosphogluconolactonase (cycloisomerase 2 family)